ncbi:hypothetical protein G9A89_008312 [Geosiphon pyriformis]|nr:hypothetical protein G9A89_008312 [Geosiphon pyriformis]
MLLDLSKKQKLRWFNDNNEDIMPKCTHNTDASGIEIPATTMVQLASRSSLAKKRINIKKEIIDARYVENIIVILQNDSEKAYIIDPNEKITQAIFLSLVKIAQLVLVKSRKELRITTKGIQRFGSMNRIDVLVNMAEKEVINKEEIIFTRQPIFISPYDQYMLAIKREVKDQAQLFKAEATICESKKIGLTNFYIPAKSPKTIKISIYNTTRNVIKIPKRTIIGYLTIETKQLLSALIRTIGTDEHGESRPTPTDAIKDVIQQFQ